MTTSGITYSERVGKLDNQLTRGLITYGDYQREMALAYSVEMKRVDETRKPWVLIEHTVARPIKPSYYSTRGGAERVISSYEDTYSTFGGTNTKVTTLLDGEGSVTSFKDGDGDIAVFIIQKRNI